MDKLNAPGQELMIIGQALFGCQENIQQPHLFEALN